MYVFDYMSMTPEEKKTFFILMVILLLGLGIYGIYYYFKNKNKD